MHDRSSDLTLLEAWDALQVFITGPVVAAGALPGMLICAPGLICFVAVLFFPLVLAAILLSLVAILLLLIAAPVLVVRAILARAHRRRTFRRRSTSSSIAGAPGS
jgi:membrane protein implicated in regulation of membrane protease activity